jgi:hypothetical protein
MRWRLVILTGCALIGLGGVAKATGIVDGGPTVSLQEALEAKATRLQAKIEGISPDVLQSHGIRGPRGRRGARGPAGPKGASGATGAAGPKGTFGSVTLVKGAPVILGPFTSPSAVGSAEAACPAGTTLVGGGYQGGTIEFSVSWDAPTANSWAVIATNNSELFSATLYADALCATP